MTVNSNKEDFHVFSSKKRRLDVTLKQSLSILFLILFLSFISIYKLNFIKEEKKQQTKHNYMERTRYRRSVSFV